jgi:hypothetical protein
MEVVVIGESAKDFYSHNTYSLVGKNGNITESMTKDDLLLVYDRPVYKAQNPSEKDWSYADEYEYVYYLGSHWNVADWAEGDFYANFVADEAPAHAFWDSLFKGSGYAFSKMTKSGLPLGLDWQPSSRSKSRADFSPFLAHYPFKAEFHCIKNSCEEKNPCGKSGECIHGKCVCNNCFGGYFCEYSIDEPSAYTQFIEWLIKLEGLDDFFGDDIFSDDATSDLFSAGRR